MKKFSDVVILTFGRIFIMLTSVISIRIFTTLLSPSEIGRLNIFMAICGWFGLVLINPVGMYVNRKIIEWNNKGLVFQYLVSLLKYLLLVTVFALFTTIMLKEFIGFGIELKILWIFVIIGGSILITSNNTSFLGWLNLFGQRFLFVIFSIATLWLGLLLSSIFVLKINTQAEYWFLGQIVGQGLILVPAILLFLRILKKSSSVNYEQDFTPKIVFDFVWPLTIGTFLYWVHTQGYRFIYQKISGLETLGLFTVGFGIGSNLMISFDTLFNQYYHPIFYNEITNANEQQRTIVWNKYSFAFFPAIILVAAYVGVNGPLLANIFTGEKFHRVGSIVFWGVIAEGLRMMTSTTAMVSHAQLKTKPLIIPSIIGALTAITGVAIFVRFDPFIGGGFALSFAWLLAFIYLFGNMKKLLPIQLPVKRMLYGVTLSFPLFFLLFINKFYSNFTIVQSLVILILSGLYMLFAQFVLARKWLALPLKISTIDNMEDKLKLYFYKITNI